MPGPPDDPVLEEIWSDLIGQGIDPDEVFKGAEDGFSRGGIYLDDVVDLLSHIVEAKEAWEYLWVHVEPTPMQWDSEYEFTWSVVEWDEDEDAWTPKRGMNTLTTYLNEKFHNDLPRLSAENLTKTVMSENVYEGTVTDVTRADIPQSLSRFVQAARGRPLEVRFHVEPDTVGESYEFSWQFVEWRPDEDGYVPLTAD